MNKNMQKKPELVHLKIGFQIRTESWRSKCHLGLQAVTEGFRMRTEPRRFREIRSTAELTKEFKL